MSTFLWSSISSITPFMFNHLVLSLPVLFFLFCHIFIGVGLKSTLSVIHFCKITCGFSSIRQSGNTNTGFDFCALTNNRCTVTNTRHTLKSDVIGHWSCTAFVIYTDPNTKELAAKLYSMQLLTVNIWWYSNWNHIIVRLVLFNY